MECPGGRANVPKEQASVPVTEATEPSDPSAEAFESVSRNP